MSSPKNACVGGYVGGESSGLASKGKKNPQDQTSLVETKKIESQFQLASMLSNCQLKCKEDFKRTVS